jgi:hypothetical protein
MIFSSGQNPSENIITSGNITPNPPSGGSINDKNSQNYERNFQSGYVYSGLAVTREYHVTLRNHANLGGKNNGQQRIRLSEYAKKLPF